jgi:hypothetical protein
VANELVILCGTASDFGVPASSLPPLRLAAWGPGANVHLNIEHVSRAMLGRIPSAFLDLIELAVYVYCADQAVRRGEPTDRKFGECWRRRLRFRVSVRCPDVWNDPETRRLLVDALSFLSEDEYDFQFEPGSDLPPPRDTSRTSPRIRPIQLRRSCCSRAGSTRWAVRCERP